jgi:hypothetical protein
MIQDSSDEAALPSDDDGMTIDEIAGTFCKIPRPSKNSTGCGCRSQCLQLLDGVEFMDKLGRFTSEFEAKSHTQQEHKLFHLLRDMRMAQQANSKQKWKINLGDSMPTHHHHPPYHACIYCLNDSKRHSQTHDDNFVFVHVEVTHAW